MKKVFYNSNLFKKNHLLVILVLFFIFFYFSHIFAKDSIKHINIHGYLYDSKNIPLKNITIMANTIKCKTDDKGFFSLKIPYNKKVTVKVKLNPKKFLPIKKTLFPNNKKDISLRLIAYKKINDKDLYCGLSGTISDSKNTPLKGANVILYNKKITLKAITDNHGFYQILSKIPGKYNLKIIAPPHKIKIIKNIILKKRKVIFKDIRLDIVKSKSTIKKRTLKIVKRRSEEDSEIKHVKNLLKEDEDKIASGGIADKKELSAKVYEEPFSSDKFVKSSIPAAHPTPKNSGLKASFVDDNKQFNYFLDFLAKYKNKVKHYDMDIRDRFIIKVIDKDKNYLPDVSIEIYSTKDSLLESGLTYSDGTYLFFASMYPEKNFILKAKYKNQTVSKRFSVQDKRKIRIVFDKMKRTTPQEIPLDILFIFDTTGSMGEEIERLKNTIDIIKMNITEFKPQPDTRFGMVLYKDIKDIYVTKVIPFTADFDKFSEFIHKKDIIFASGGGGDGPEDLQKALKDAMTQIKWRQKGVKIAFIITDAPPHLYKHEKDFTYVKAAMEAKKRGIKLFSVGTGGLNLQGEYILRQLSQFTYANYIFLTYGEKGESEGGKVGSVSHHTGENFTTDKLEAILIQIIKRELKFYSGKEVTVPEEYFQANAVDTETTKQTLEQIFKKGITQLYDYSTIKIEKDTPTAISPIITSQENLKATAEYFYENLQLALVKTKKFKAVERKDLQPVLDELKFQLDELADESKAAELGKFIGAKLLITGKMYEKGDYYELYLKLENVETIEILSVTKLRISKKLGL